MIQQRPERCNVLTIRDQTDAVCRISERREAQCIDHQRGWICAGVSGLVVVGTGQVTRWPAGTQERAEPGSRW